MIKKKIFILDDHKIIRDGLKSIFHQHPLYEVSGEEGDPVNFFESIKRLSFDVLILDLSFPAASGFDLIPKIKKLKPQVLIIILSMHNNPEFMQKALLLGAHCYLPKDSDAQEVLHALDVICSGGTYVSKNVPTPKPLATTTQSENPLTARESEILKLWANGFSSKQIAADLSISVRTVETHRLNIMNKLGSANSAETISIAVKLNLL